MYSYTPNILQLSYSNHIVQLKLFLYKLLEIIQYHVSDVEGREKVERT